MDFYNDLFNRLLVAGITPWVTLFHWDTPSGVHNRSDTGSFLSKDIIPIFNDYADFCFKTFGDRVKNWITLNEPWTYAWNGYGWGVLAPGRCSIDKKCETIGGGGNSSTEPYIVGHNLLLSHAAAFKTYKEKYFKTQGGRVGMACNNDFGLPWNASDPDDVKAASRRLAFQFSWFVDPIVFGDYPPEMREYINDGRLPVFTPEEKAAVMGSYDYIGLNHYTTKYIVDVKGPGGYWEIDTHTEMNNTNSEGHLIGPSGQSGWLSVYPPGIRGVLNWVSDRYNFTEIYMFENGVSVPKESEMPIALAVHDDFRVDMYRNYISNLIDAATLDGVKVNSYFAWSLVDNFEWADGYNTRFGLTYVDYKNNQKRYIKDSFIWYSMFTQTYNLYPKFTNPYDLDHH